MALLALIALSSFVFTADPKGELAIASIKVHPAKTPRYNVRKRDMAFVNFNVTADLTPLFHWNTKQVFLYLEAEFESPSGIKNEVVIWDRIVRRKEDATLNIAGRNKYAFRNIGASFRDATPATYSLKYNVMPYVGMLTYGEAARTKETVEFPASEARV